jgi:antitoxin (DNA-binding transcriptional repressor) of toxin-antitoxin stability system
MATTETISASEFKAKCLNILDRLAGHELDRVVITNRGTPVAFLLPPEHPADAVRDIYGFMRGSVIIADDVDLTAPVLDQPFTADNGDLHG